jgi:hypothetical protein
MVIVGRNSRQSGANPLWQAGLSVRVMAGPVDRGGRNAFHAANESGSKAADLRRWEGDLQQLTSRRSREF